LDGSEGAAFWVFLVFQRMKAPRGWRRAPPMKRDV
jgi:hypothetical protein